MIDGAIDEVSVMTVSTLVNTPWFVYIEAVEVRVNWRVLADKLDALSSDTSKSTAFGAHIPPFSLDVCQG